MCQLRKTRLGPSQLSDYIACLRTLQAEGICVDIPEEWLEYSRRLDIVIAPPPISVAFDWPTGGTGYAVWVRLLSRKRCMLEDCALTVPWEEDIIIQSVDECKSQCEFGKLVFPLEKVLSHRIENTLRFPRAGHLVEGVILGRGVSRIPEQYASLGQVPFTLTLYDQYGDEMTDQGNLLVERARKRMKAIKVENDGLCGDSQNGFTEVSAEAPHRNNPLVNPGRSTQVSDGNRPTAL